MVLEALRLLLLLLWRWAALELDVGVAGGKHVHVSVRYFENVVVERSVFVVSRVLERNEMLVAGLVVV